MDKTISVTDYRRWSVI